MGHRTAFVGSMAMGVSVAGIGAVVVVLASSLRLGSLAGGLAAALFGVLVVGWTRRVLIDLRVVWTVLGPALGSLWVLSHALGSMPMGALVLLVLSPWVAVLCFWWAGVREGRARLGP